MSWPPKKSWKLRWRKARRVAGNPIARGAEPVRVCGSELGELLNRNLSKFAYVVQLSCSATVPVAVVGRSVHDRRGQMPALHFLVQHFRMLMLRVSIQSGLAALDFGLVQFGASQMGQEAVKSERPQPRLRF